MSLANQVGIVSRAQVNIPTPGAETGTGTIVQKTLNPDGSSTYYALTAKHVVRDPGSGRQMAGEEPGENISIPKYVITQSGAFPIQSMYRDPSGKDLALFSFTVPPGGKPLTVAKVSSSGGADLSGKPIVLVGGAPEASTRPELVAEGANLKPNGGLCSYTAPVNLPAKPLESDASSPSDLPPGLVSFPSKTLPTEPGTSGSAYVGPSGIAGVHYAVSSQTEGGPDKGRTYVTPVDSRWVTAGVTALESGTGPDVRHLDPPPNAANIVGTYYKKYDLPRAGKSPEAVCWTPS